MAFLPRSSGRRVLALSSLVWLLWAPAGCGTATFIVQQYDGKPLAQDRIALVRLDGDQPLRLEELDGEVLGYELHDRGARIHIEILPGEHELGIAEGAGLPLKRRRFHAEPGRVYRPMLVRTKLDRERLNGAPWVVGIYEVDRDSDEIIREISQLPTAPAAATVPAPPTTATPSSTVPPTPAVTPTPAVPTEQPSTTPSAAVSTLDAVAPPTVTGTAKPLPNSAPTAPPGPPLSPVPSGVAPAVGPAPAESPPPATPL